MPIHPQHWKYLGVHFEDEQGVITYWVWTVLCLGLRDACNLFTRLTRPVIAHLRRRGMRCLIYIDDSWVVGKSFEECLKKEEEMKKAFEESSNPANPGSSNPAKGPGTRVRGADS